MIRKITPIVTWVPWKPVIMKKVEPNCAAPQGLPQGRTPSLISLVHSKRLHSDECGAKCRGHQHQNRSFNAIMAVAEIDRHRHRPAAADQDEGHDGDQDERDFVPPIVKAKTSLGFGQGTVVDIRTVM